MGDVSRFTKLVRRAAFAYSARSRRRKSDMILKFLAQHHVDSVLLVGATGDEYAGNPLQPHTGIIERRVAAHYPIKMGINVVPAVTPYPFMVADVRAMPFADEFVDFALANAVIEHVGGIRDQQRMVDEMTRVARSWVITTPNKWFPVEAHSHAVFLHWFPGWRRRCNERRAAANLSQFDLLSLRQFRRMMPAGTKIVGKPWSPTFTAIYNA
ncbi:methyltransferase domain-containing protein [Mycolicibacterium pulveris]|uniref:methyltransferase domain-containing protein n=1 Tax=Mycolicibacterium pulveris TaxID=36813 RepID=UPI003CEB9D30